MAKLETKFFIFIFSIILLLVFLGSSFIGGIFFEKSRNKGTVTNITNQSVIDKISDQAFLVTKTIYIDQSTEIVVDQGSEWSNFWWGQTIEAEAMVRGDVGVDFAKITAEDIKIDELTNKIIISTPKATLLDINTSGDIKVLSKSGVLKYLLANDPNKDRNLATEELINKAKDTIIVDALLMNEAEKSSEEVIRLLLSDFGYEVVVVTGN